MWPFNEWYKVPVDNTPPPASKTDQILEVLEDLRTIALYKGVMCEEDLFKMLERNDVDK